MSELGIQKDFIKVFSVAVFYVNHIVFQQFLVYIQSRQKYWIGIIFFNLDKALFKGMILLEKYIRINSR